MLRDNGKPLRYHAFSRDYYFMGGDKGENSRDSRYRVLLPDGLIVGKAWPVGKSVDLWSVALKRDRILKKVE